MHTGSKKHETPTDANNVLAAAYSQNWDKVKKYVNQNGWCRLSHSLFPDVEKEFNRHKVYWWRPKSLSGFLGCR